MNRLFSWIVDHPWPAIAVVLAATVVVGLGLPRLQINTDFESYLDSNDPSVVARERAEERFGSQDTLMISLVAPETVFDAEILQTIEELTTRIEALPGVDEVMAPLNAQLIEATEDSLIVGPAAPDERAPETEGEIAAHRDRILSSNDYRDLLVSASGRAACLYVAYQVGSDSTALTRQIADLVDQTSAALGGAAELEMTGIPYMSLAMSKAMGSDLTLLLPIALAIIILVLFLSFRSVRGVALPLSVVVLSIVWTFGLTGWIGLPVTMISFIFPVLLLAIGIAYGIHILSHANERLLDGGDHRAAVKAAMAHINAPVLMAGLTTVAGFLALTTSFLPVLAQFGFGSAIGVVVAMALSLILIPAILSLLPPTKRRPGDEEGGCLGRILSRWGRFVGTHGQWVLMGTVVVIGAFALGVPRMTTDSSVVGMLGDNNPTVIGMQVMEDHLSGSEQILIEVDTGRRDGLKDPAVLAEMKQLEAFLEGLGIRKTTSLTGLIEELNRKFHGDDASYETIPDDRRLISQLLLLFSFQGGDLGSLALGDYSAGEVVGIYPKVSAARLAEIVQSVQTYLDEEFGAGIAGGLSAAMVGATQLTHRMTSQLMLSQLVSLAVAVVIAAAVVSLLMRSIVAGLIAVIPLVSTLVVNFGVMGYSGVSLNIATGITASITIGIGIDYAIHFISRYRAGIREGRSRTEAVVATMRTSGKAILFNAVSVIGGFLVLSASSFLGLSQFGQLIALSMAVSAFSALTVIPAIFVQWQPRFLASERTWHDIVKGRHALRVRSGKTIKQSGS